MDNGLGKLDMTEVSRTLARLVAACLAAQTRVDYTEVQIHKTLGVGETVVIVGICPDDLSDTHLADVFWRKKTELNFSDSLWTCHFVFLLSYT